jgi:hypothetical protein
MFVLYYVYKDTPFHIIKKTLEDILRKAAELLLFQTMAPDEEYNESNLPQISIHPQVPRLKGVDTLGYNKLPYHVRENCKALHIKVRPEDKKELKDLFQFAKEQNIVTLCLGKRAHISKVMDMLLLSPPLSLP